MGTVDCSPEVRLYAGYRHLAGSPADGPAWLEVAHAHVEEGNSEQAEAIVDELLRLDCPGLYPQLCDEDPQVYRAYIRAEEGRYGAALEIMDALRSKHEDSPVYHFFVATLLHEDEDFAAASEEYQQALDALEAFRREVEAEDLELDSSVDFDEAQSFIESCLEKSRQSAALDLGGRPIDLSGLREE